MRHMIIPVFVLATLAGCGSEGPNTPSDAGASFAVSARVVPVRCALATCPAPALVSIPVRVTEAGGIIGGYVTSLDFVIRDAASGSVLEARHYHAAEIRSMTQLESNQVYPNAWLEIVPLPFRSPIVDGANASSFTVAVTITDYHGKEHHQTLNVPAA